MGIYEILVIMYLFPIIPIILFIVASIIYLIYNYKTNKKTPAWLKGGVILLILDYAFWRILLSILDPALSRDLGGMTVDQVAIYGMVSLIPAFIVGAIIGALIGSAAKNVFKSKKFFSLTTKIILLVGVVISIIASIYNVNDCFSHRLSWNCNAVILMTIIILLGFLAFSWVVWVVRGFINR